MNSPRWALCASKAECFGRSLLDNPNTGMFVAVDPTLMPFE